MCASCVHVLSGVRAYYVENAAGYWVSLCQDCYSRNLFGDQLVHVDHLISIDQTLAIVRELPYNCGAYRDNNSEWWSFSGAREEEYPGSNETKDDFLEGELRGVTRLEWKDIISQDRKNKVLFFLFVDGNSSPSAINLSIFRTIPAWQDKVSANNALRDRLNREFTVEGVKIKDLQSVCGYPFDFILFNAFMSRAHRLVPNTYLW